MIQKTKTAKKKAAPVIDIRFIKMEPPRAEGQCKKDCAGGNACVCRDDRDFPHVLHACTDTLCLCHSKKYLNSMRPPQPGERRRE
jgi:hypothetical protein